MEIRYDNVKPTRGADDSVVSWLLFLIENRDAMDIMALEMFSQQVDAALERMKAKGNGS